MWKVNVIVLFAVILVSFGCASDGKPTLKTDPYAEFGDLLEKMRSTEVVHRNGTKIFGKGKLEHREYIRVLYLKGSAFEMGYQYATLLNLKKERGTDSYLQGSKRKRTLRYLRQIESKIPSELTNEIKGMAAAIGIDYKFMLAAELFSELRRMSCTTMAAHKGATVDGSIIYLRTMENPAKWHRYREILVIFRQPDHGNSFVSIGGGIGVYSGMNEEKITIDDNMIPYVKDGFRRDGIPLRLYRRMIIQHAGNMDDVQKFIETHIPSDPNNILITDGKTNEMRVYEVAGSKHAVRRPENGILCSTNHPLMLNLDLVRKYEGSYERYDVGTDYLKKHHGKIDSGKLKEFIKSDFMAELFKRREKVLQYIVVMAPKSLDFWVAVQKRDNKPASHNQFIKFNLLEELKK